MIFSLFILLVRHVATILGSYQHFYDSFSAAFILRLLYSFNHMLCSILSHWACFTVVL